MQFMLGFRGFTLGEGDCAASIADMQAEYMQWGLFIDIEKDIASCQHTIHKLNGGTN